MEFKDLLPMPPSKGPPLPRFLGQRWLGTPISKEKLQELIEGVPDENNPDIICYWREVDDKLVYLEGWADECLAGTGFPSIEEGDHQEKINYIEDLTEITLKKKTTDKENPWGIELKLIQGGFVELPEANNLYGVSYGIYEKAE